MPEFRVVRQIKYGMEVAVSAVIEEMRRTHCLCLNCVHLDKNIALEEKLVKECDGDRDAARTRMIRLASGELTLRERRPDLPIVTKDMCSNALINYANCVTGSLAMAITRCPVFEQKPSTTTGDKT